MWLHYLYLCIADILIENRNADLKMASGSISVRFVVPNVTKKVLPLLMHLFEGHRCPSDV